VIVEAVHQIVIDRRAHWWEKRARYLKKIDNSRATVLQVQVTAVFSESSECLLTMFQFVYTADSM
jgi:hypothetical protein